MKKILFFLLVSILSFGQEKDLTLSSDLPLIKVEASCGICMFDMEGKECELAVKTNGKKYYVIGTGIDDHGDAHSKTGFCNAILNAKVQGEIINNKFNISYFKLTDIEKNE
tara:strand:+ start:2668 stop:3000 length:333 start_codon:yes stop_codon:yes gene_type:complete